MSPAKDCAAWRPGPADLQAAAGRTVADVIAPGLKVLFCGINPGLFSAATGWHFARPGNRFWPALERAGITPRLLAPCEQELLLEWGLGITNFVERASAGAAELSASELAEGGQRLAQKTADFKPGCLAVLGLGAYRSAFNRPQARPGLQSEQVAGVSTWLLPNPSGLNAHTSLDDLAMQMHDLWNWIHTRCSLDSDHAVC